METAVVLFVHHKNDAVTRFHYEMLVQKNDFPIVPLFCNDGNGVPLENAVELEKTFSRGSNWHNVDWICRDWFNSTNRIEAKRYIWLDWDCFVNQPIRRWYGKLWSCDFVACRIKKRGSSWGWFKRQQKSIPSSLSEFVVGVAPLNGVLLSRKAMEIYATAEIPDGVFSELRLPTVLASQNIVATTMPKRKAKKNRYFSRKGRNMKVTGKGLFHPVKELEAFHNPTVS